MPKDNENVRLPFVGPVDAQEPQAFAPDQMVRCDECLRANPPTRVACLYCGASLPLTEESVKLRRPTLRPPERHELGYNIIFSGKDQNLPEAEVIAQASALLRLTNENLYRLLSAGDTLPVAVTANREEAHLVFERLHEMGLETLILSDDDLGVVEKRISRVRSMRFDNIGATLQQSGHTAGTNIAWTELALLVKGRLLEKRVEVKERTQRKTENEILDTSEFYADETVVDLYSGSQEQTWRVAANSFDFSCLGEQKSLMANENMGRLVTTITTRAPQVLLDDSYNARRQILDPVWTHERETLSRGWRREGPGKYSLGAAVIDSNESQFNRYSRLRFYFHRNPQNATT